MNDFLEIARGTTPLIVSMPHTGTDIPADIESRLISPWLGRRDADWWIEKLYDFAPHLGASVIRMRISRTVIDANRDPSGASLYPGQATTELCPTTTFDGEPLYRYGHEPNADEIAERRKRWFDPYHAAIADEIARVKAQHGVAILWDAHSIRSVIPRLFEGELPNLNFGTNGGTTCAPALTDTITDAASRAPFSMVVNGRFKGGWTTRHYGRPRENVHAIQLELACRTYLREHVGHVDETDWPVDYDPGFAAPLRALLTEMLASCITTGNRHEPH